MKPNILTNEFREKSFYFSLLLFVIVLPFSEAFVSIAAAVLLLQSILFYPWRFTKIVSFEKKTALLLFAIYLIYLLGLIQTNDWSLAFYELKKVVFWIVIPLAFLLAPNLSEKRFYNVLYAFCIAVCFASFLAITRLIFKDTFEITDFRDISLISHIRYSYQVALAIFCTFFLWYQNISKKNRNLVLILTVLLGWLMFFMVLLKSITGIVSFIGAISFLMLYYLIAGKRKLKYLFSFLLLLALIFSILYVKSVWEDFYAIEKLDAHMVDSHTKSGNPYTFNFDSFEKENGHWVQCYVCNEELRREWNKRSECKFDSLDQNGFTYQSTLIRYLTSKGLRKDSVGVNTLSEKDMKAIEQGYANYIYVDKKFSLYPRIYETIWEYDRYKATGDPNGQSLSQRIEFFKASLEIIKNNFWFGIGTGNWKEEYAHTYKFLNSNLSPENQRSSHNQYLNYMVKFGLIGFFIIISFLLIPVFREGHQSNLLFWLFLVFMGIANLGDANFESHMGLSFFSFFYCLFLWNSPEFIRNFKFQKQQK
ncbi:O-antigen ligase family protein [uncultured Draconibacterium sp.]|uniref:O-antigen ligase family protein n=1 Tax=uncultured Draconibacterium sp. TaxID=1573823 RepID=UPI0032615F02